MLFEKIRDSGLVKWSVKTAGELRNRKRFFADYEEKLDYVPVFIVRREEIGGREEVASLSLQFDRVWVPGDGGAASCH